MIVATTTALPASRNPERTTAWRCSCEWQGATVHVQSRTGASLELCRVLVASGVPDQGMKVRNADGMLMLGIGSIHKAATRTISESAKTPIREAKWQPFEEGLKAPARDGQNGGSEPEDDVDAVANENASTGEAA